MTLNINSGTSIRGNISINYLDIVRNGLVLYLDAGNQLSYLGSGSTWTDLSGNNNNGTLINGPTYNPINGGVIYFDGTDDYVAGPIQDVGSTYTYNIWVYALGRSPGKTFMSTMYTQGVANAFYQYGGSNVFQFNGGYGGGPPLPSLNQEPMPAGAANQWVMLTGCQTTTKSKVYVNGTLLWDTTLYYYSANLGTIYNIGQRGDTLLTCLNGYVSNVQIYSRELSATEVTQNFNAKKSRFGL
jgi:hypothetical protein